MIPSADCDCNAATQLTQSESREQDEQAEEKKRGSVAVRKKIAPHQIDFSSLIIKGELCLWEPIKFN